LTTVKNAGPTIELIKIDAVFENNKPDLTFELIPHITSQTFPIRIVFESR
jgi:hypothetical protein